MKSSEFIVSVVLASMLMAGCGGGGDTSVSKKVSTTPKMDVKLDTLADTKEKSAQKQDTTQTEKKEQTKEGVFYISSKVEYKEDENITTSYSYINQHLSELKTTSTSGASETKKYRYFEDNRVVKTYTSSGLLLSVAVFEKLKKPNQRYIYDNSLSLNPKREYITLPYDTLKVQDREHIVKLIDPNSFGNRYSYDNQDRLIKIENGMYDDNNSQVPQLLEDDTNTSYLLSGPLRFVPEQETEYIYDANGAFKAVSFKGADEFSADVTVTFYDNNRLKDMTISTGDSFHYDENGLLKSKTRTIHGEEIKLNYIYTNDGKRVTVKDGNGKLVKEYRFEDIKGDN